MTNKEDLPSNIDPLAAAIFEDARDHESFEVVSEADVVEQAEAVEESRRLSARAAEAIEASKASIVEAVPVSAELSARAMKAISDQLNKPTDVVDLGGDKPVARVFDKTEIEAANKALEAPIVVVDSKDEHEPGAGIVLTMDEAGVFHKQSQAEVVDDMIEGIGQDIASAVFDELRSNPIYDELSESEHDDLLFVVKRKADLIRALEMNELGLGEKRFQNDILNSAKSLKSIESSMSLLSALRVHAVIKDVVKRLAAKAASIAIKAAL